MKVSAVGACGAARFSALVGRHEVVGSIPPHDQFSIFPQTPASASRRRAALPSFVGPVA